MLDCFHLCLTMKLSNASISNAIIHYNNWLPIIILVIKKDKIQPRRNQRFKGNNASITCVAPLESQVFWNFSGLAWPSNVFISKYSSTKSLDDQSIQLILSIWNVSVENAGTYRCISEKDYVVEEDEVSFVYLGDHSNYTGDSIEEYFSSMKTQLSNSSHVAGLWHMFLLNTKYKFCK